MPGSGSFKLTHYPMPFRLDRASPLSVGQAAGQCAISAMQICYRIGGAIIRPVSFQSRFKPRSMPRGLIFLSYASA
jgi:hypothetical protein